MLGRLKARDILLVIFLTILVIIFGLFVDSALAQDGSLPGEQLQEPGVHQIYAWSELNTQLLYVAGNDNFAAIQLAGYQNGVSSLSFERSTVEEIQFQSLPTNDRVAVAFQVVVIRNVDLSRDINIDLDVEGFSLSNLTGLLGSQDSMSELFEQIFEQLVQPLAQNIVDIMEARDIKCVGTISDNNVLMLAC